MSCHHTPVEAERPIRSLLCLTGAHPFYHFRRGRRTWTIQSILDAEHLLKHFNELNTKPPPPDIEVLKRAGLVMAMTAWETYVEDRVAEATDERLRSVGDESIARFVRSKLKDEIAHTPSHSFTKSRTIERAISDRWKRDFCGVL